MTDEQFRSALNELAAEALKSMRRKRTTKQMTTLEAIPWIESLESTDKEQAEAKRIAIEAMQKELPDTWIIGREDGRLTYTHDTEDCLTIVNVGFPYCPYCGKKMKL